MDDLSERLTRCADTYLHLYTDRYTNLGPDYDPDFSCPLSDEQIEQFQSDVDYIEEYHGDTGINDLIYKLKFATREFLDVNIIPEIMEQMSQPHFIKSFSLFVKVIEGVYHDLLDKVLPDFPGRDDLSRTLYDSCILKVYTDFEDVLLTVVFTKLLDMRGQENITGHPLMYHVKGIVKHFSLFDDSKWRDPYIEKVREHTADYASSFEVDAAIFLSKALQRAEYEAGLANSFNLGGLQMSKLVKEEVFAGFVQVYNSVETIDEFINMFEQTENQEKFQNLLQLYGCSSSCHTVIPLLKQRIFSTGAQMVDFLQPQNQGWQMEALNLAVWEMGNYERRIYSRLLPHENRGIPLLTDMLLTVFKENFNDMFSNQEDEQQPEEFLASFVEWMVSRKEGDPQDLPQDMTFEDWRAQSFENINILAKHLANKEEFVKNVESQLNLFNQEEARRRHILFLNFLNMTNVRNYVTSDVRERLRNEISTRRVSAREVAERKGKVVDWVCAASAVGSHEEVLSNLIVDTHCLFVVSVPFFAGSRRSVYIRMTGLQKDILNTVLEWKELPIKELYGFMIRTDITEGSLQAKETINIVLHSLITEELLKKNPTTSSFNDEDIISINGEKILETPYVWIPAPINGEITYATNVRYSVDLMIYDFMVNENTASINDMWNFFQQTAPMHLQLLDERIEVLKTRGFIAPCPDQPDMLSFVAP